MTIDTIKCLRQRVCIINVIYRYSEYSNSQPILLIFEKLYSHKTTYHKNINLVYRINRVFLQFLQHNFEHFKKITIYIISIPKIYLENFPFFLL